MRQSRIRRFENMAKAAGVSDDGRSWLTEVLDPFHDYQFDPVGFPGTSGGRTVIQVVNQQVTIKAPAGLGPTETWDALIFNLPDIFPGFAGLTQDSLSTRKLGIPVRQLLQGDVRNNTYIHQLNGGMPDSPVYPQGSGINFLNITTGRSGADLFPSLAWNDAYLTAQAITTKSLGIGAQLVGPSRLVYGGYEVHNSTADLYKQGMVSDFRVPQITDTEDGMILLNGVLGTEQFNDTQYLADADVSSSFMAHQGVNPILASVGPPRNLAEATLIPSTVSREAADGCYVIFTMSDTSNPIRDGVQRRRVFVSKDLEGSNFFGYAIPNTSRSFYATPNGFTGSAGACPSMLPVPFDTCGSIFTGLSPQTTLNLYLRTCVETAPGPEQSTLISLAKPTNAFDPDALEVYARTVQFLPPGCSVYDNPDGEWWGAVLNAASKALPAMGKAASTFIPGAGLLGDGLGMLAEKGAEYQKRKAAEKAARSAPKQAQDQKPVQARRGKGKSGNGKGKSNASSSRG